MAKIIGGTTSTPPKPTDAVDLSSYYNKNEVDEKLGGKADETYIDEQVGDIETALDSIIAIQEELIGGGA